MVRLHPHRQSIVSGTHATKLDKWYYGPYQIPECIGKAAYKLQLPNGTWVHLVFHCSLLKPFHHSTSYPISPLPLPGSSIDNQPLITLLAILQTRRDSTIVDSKLKVLVQWEALSLDDTSWEDWDQLKATYHLEDKVVFRGMGNNMKQEPRMQSTLRERSTRKVTTPGYLRDYVERF